MSISAMKNSIILFFAILLLVSCKNKKQNLVKIEAKQLPITENISPKKEIEDFVKPFKEKVDGEMNTVLSYTPKNLERTDGKLESTLGNLLADLCFKKANPVFNARTGKNIDFAMFNYGGIRAGISKGSIAYNNAFKLMPFENYLVVVELTSEKLNELIQYLVAKNKAHPLSKNVSLTISKKGYDFKINNNALKPDRTYYVLTSDYLQKGGDNMNFFKNPVNLYQTDYKMRNAIIDYFKETDTIKVELDGRFKSKN